MGAKHSKLFNIIAPIYGIFYNFQVKYFHKMLAKTKSTIDLSTYKTVLDVGCGTGALCYVLHKNRALLTTIIECAERGDYFDFIKVAEDEMREHFKYVEVLDVYERAAWYILEPYK